MDENLQMKKWTGLLKGLHLGTHTIPLGSVGEIDSLKSVGYRLNSQCYEKQFQFHPSYKQLVLVVEVTKRNVL